MQQVRLPVLALKGVKEQLKIMVKNINKAFTLIELILVISIIIILSAVGVISYNKSKQRATQKEGFSNTKLIVAAERIYRMEQGSYVDCQCTTAADCTNVSGCNSLLKLLLNTKNWNYNVTGSSATNVTIQAASTSGGCTYKTDKDTLDSDPVASGCI